MFKQLKLTPDISISILIILKVKSIGYLDKDLVALKDFTTLPGIVKLSLLQYKNVKNQTINRIHDFMTQWMII